MVGFSEPVAPAPPVRVADSEVSEAALGDHRSTGTSTRLNKRASKIQQEAARMAHSRRWTLVRLPVSIHRPLGRPIHAAYRALLTQGLLDRDRTPQNEPWGGSWSEGDAAKDWPRYASRLGNIVLRECPRWLIFVEGVGVGGGDHYCEPSTDWSGCFWGENMIGLTLRSVRLSHPERLVYSPHLYGPGTNGRMFYFNRSAFPQYPANLNDVWSRHFLGPVRAAGATLIIGEWGGRYTDLADDADQLWQQQLKSVLLEERLSSFYWALNPNSGDTGGILGDDWEEAKTDKLALLNDLPSSNVALALASTPAFTCPSTLTPDVHAANERFFRCADAEGGGGPLCVHVQQACNGVSECPDHSDERRGACRAVDVREQPCLTVGGQDALRACVLPFAYRGVQYDACALDDAVDGKAWCPTQVTVDDKGVGHYMSFGAWGLCGPGCDREAGRKLRSDGCEPPDEEAEPAGVASIDTPGRAMADDASARKHDSGTGAGGRSGGGGGRAEDENEAEWQVATLRPLPPLPVHCAPPPLPPPSPPTPPPSPPPPAAPPPWTIADTPSEVLLLAGALMLVAAIAAARAAYHASYQSLPITLPLTVERGGDDGKQRTGRSSRRSTKNIRPRDEEDDSPAGGGRRPLRPRGSDSDELD